MPRFRPISFHGSFVSRASAVKYSFAAQITKDSNTKTKGRVGPLPERVLHLPARLASGSRSYRSGTCFRAIPRHSQREEVTRLPAWLQGEASFLPADESACTAPNQLSRSSLLEFGNLVQGSDLRKRGWYIPGVTNSVTETRKHRTLWARDFPTLHSLRSSVVKFRAQTAEKTRSFPADARTHRCSVRILSFRFQELQAYPGSLAPCCQM